jgi:hypothetical protein
VTPALLFAILVLGSVLLAVASRLRAAKRAEYIRHYDFPKGLIERLQKRRPGLAAKDGQLVAHALRQFFLAYLKGNRQFVSMPSQVADDLWHEFILYTRHYEMFCRRAFGRFLHHTPAAALGSVRSGNAGLRRVWWQVCKEENINPRRPTRLPLLFALDTKLGVADGFHYVADCDALRRRNADGSAPTAVVYCGNDFASPSYDGSIDGFGDGGGGDGGDGGGDGGGCGGGCGGD